MMETEPDWYGWTIFAEETFCQVRLAKGTDDNQATLRA